MAKKTPVKKSKRRLKRGVRRSLAAVLMITAIGVAAIPVPENYAEEPGVEEGDTPGTSDSTDPHAEELAGFIFEPKAATKSDNGKVEWNNDEHLNYTNFELDTYAGMSDAELVQLLDKGVFASYSIRDLGNGTDGQHLYNLSWQFMFYETTNPRGAGTAGVICKYNSQFSTDKVDLSLYPITKYFTIEEEDIDTYYSKEYWTASGDNVPTISVEVTGPNPNNAITYTYDDYVANKRPNDFLTKYFEDDVKEYQGIFETYKKEHEEDEVEDPNKPQALSKTPSDDLKGDARTAYFAEHCVTLQNAYNEGEEYGLYPVQDGRPGHTGTVYLAKGGTPTTRYFVGDHGFLAEKRSAYDMCAIGEQAFKGVTNVSNMEIPEQIGYIGDEAFMDASLLQSVTLNNVLLIGNRAFKGCVNLTTVELGAGTQIVGQECFSGDRKLQSIKFGDSTKTIGYGAFYDCRGLTSVTFASDGQECTVKDFAFYNCTSLTEVTMENANIKSLGEAVFATDAGAQPTHFVLPKTMSDSDSIGNFLFAGRAGLEYVIFPQEYGRSSSPKTEIPSSVFHGCVNLQYVQFPCNEQSDPYACGFVTYDSKLLFADIINPDFYVRGPELNSNSAVALPRRATWSAVTAVSKTVPYLYTSGGVEYYEVSDGFYLLCIDDEGILTSCTLVPDAKLEDWDGELVIPSVVGNITVKGIASNCFSDSKLNENVVSLVIEDNSEIESIAAGAFQGGRGTNNADWLKLKKVYIGNSITSIGDNAFKDCNKLIDVTFSTPLNGYDSFTIGTDAFKTQSSELTFHGDIVVGYEPFEWATDPVSSIIEEKSDLRVCYKSLAPTYLTVMYNPITKMVTLLDYPKYAEIDTLLQEAFADEIAEAKCKTYAQWREWTLYNQFRAESYDAFRANFAIAWQAALSATNPDEAKAAVFADRNSYGPWINPEFCEGDNWQNYLPEGARNSEKNEGFFDWLFEPIVAYAAEDDLKLEPYYKKHPYVVTQAVNGNDSFFPPTTEERGLVYYTTNIDVPAGVESIDVYGYVNNLTADGEQYTAGDESNTANYGTYLWNGWDNASRDMYEREFPADEDGIRSVPGLFSGHYVDGTAAIQENRKRGNDVIMSVTMHSVKYLPDYAFDSCEGLTYVILGPDCADIGKAPFRGCDSMITVGDNDYYTTVNGIIYSVNTDGSYTIEECLAGRGNLVGQAVVNASADPNLLNVSAIKPGAFEDCDYLTEVNFGSNDTAGLMLIPEDCFKNADRLQTVILPMTTNEVAKGAFVGANNLTGLTVYGKEVQISARAFDGAKDTWTTVRAYANSAVVRYVGQYGEEYKLRYDEQHPLGEIWQVSFYDSDYVLIEDLKDKDGNDLDNPQYVEDGARPTEPATPEKEGWTFERWVGNNNVNLGDAIHEDTSFFAQGYTESGMVGGKYPVSFWDGVDGTQVGPTQYIDPGSDAIAPGHPVHAGYEQDGYSDTYTNIQSPKTIILKYKPTGTSGSGTGSGSGSGSGSNGSTSNQNSSTSTSSTTSGSNSNSATAKYTVTVENGSGSGSYDVGSTVIIAANTPPAGMVFQKWTTESNGVALASVSMTATTFVMPANNVTVTANYVAGGSNSGASGNVGGNTGGTGGTTGNGSTRVDITKPGISNKDLATANVNGSTDNFIVKITETDEATRAVAEALTNKYGSLENILYYAMDISLYDSTGTVKITNTTGLSVDITIPIPDALVAYGGNNMAGAVINGNQLENLNESFTTINGVPCIRFTATHFSPYTIYVDTGNLTEGMLDTTPKTGDPIHPKWFLSIGLACLSVILFMKKDKAVKVKTA